MRQAYDYWQNQPDCSRRVSDTEDGDVRPRSHVKGNLTPDRSGARPSRPRTSKCARSLHGGVSFFRLISPRDGLRLCVFTICRCALEADRRGRMCVCETCRRQGHIRLWPDCSSRIGDATRHKVCHASESKSHPPPVPQGRRPTNVMLSDARDFRVGTGRCTVSWPVVCDVRSHRRRACAARAACFGLVHIV